MHIVLASAADIIQGHPEFFKPSNFFIDFIRSMGWYLVLLIRQLSLGTDGLLNAVYDVLSISESSAFGDFYELFRPLITVGLILSLLVLGNIYMFTEKRPEVLKNFFIGLMVIFAAPQIIGTLNEALLLGKDVLYEDTTSVTDTIIAANIVDLRYLDANNWAVGDTTNNLNSEAIYNLDPAEHVTKSDEDVSSLGREIFNSRFVVTPQGGTKKINIGSKGWFDIFDPPYYYRYAIHYFQIYILLLVNVLVMIFAGYKAFSIIGELLVTRILGAILSTEITSGQKTKKVIDSFFAGYFSLFFILVCLKLHGIFQMYINAQGYGPIVRIFLMIFASLFVLEGPSIVERVFGFDVGLSNGAMKFFTAFRIAQEVSRAMPHGGHGFHGFGNDDSGHSASGSSWFNNFMNGDVREPDNPPPSLPGGGPALPGSGSGPILPIGGPTAPGGGPALTGAENLAIEQNAESQQQTAEDKAGGQGRQIKGPEFQEPNTDQGAKGTFEPDGSMSYTATAAENGQAAETTHDSMNQSELASDRTSKEMSGTDQAHRQPDENMAHPLTSLSSLQSQPDENMAHPSTTPSSLQSQPDIPRSAANSEQISSVSSNGLTQPDGDGSRVDGIATGQSAVSSNPGQIEAQKESYSNQPANTERPSEASQQSKQPGGPNTHQPEVASPKERMLDTKFSTMSVNPGIIKQSSAAAGVGQAASGQIASHSEPSHSVATPQPGEASGISSVPGSGESSVNHITGNSNEMNLSNTTGTGMYSAEISPSSGMENRPSSVPGVNESDISSKGSPQDLGPGSIATGNTSNADFSMASQGLNSTADVGFTSNPGGMESPADHSMGTLNNDLTAGSSGIVDPPSAANNISGTSMDNAAGITPGLRGNEIPHIDSSQSLSGRTLSEPAGNVFTPTPVNEPEVKSGKATTAKTTKSTARKKPTAPAKKNSKKE